MATQSTRPSIRQLMPLFSTYLSRQVLQQILREELQQRLHWRQQPPMVVLWGFIFQRLNADHTCDHYVAHLHAGGVDNLDPDDPHGQPVSQRIGSQSTAGYVQGRNRLPLALLTRARQVLQREIMTRLGDTGRWQG